MSTEKRSRQKAGRDARRAAEEKAKKRKQTIRRVITAVVILAIIAGISIAVSNSHSSKKSSSTTTTSSSTTTTTQAVPKGGSGNTSPSAITTSADCPTDFTATLNKPSWSKPPKMTIDTDKTYNAVVTTDVGSFTIQLDPKSAPTAVNNFVFLADQKFYDCITFHRAIQGFMDQTGDPTGTGTGGPGYEFTEHGPKTANPQYPVGSVAMANSDTSENPDPSTNGSQFFIVAGSQSPLPPDYVLFGKVTSGMDVVTAINNDGAPASDPTGTGKPTKLHRIISVRVTSS